MLNGKVMSLNPALDPSQGLPGKDQSLPTRARPSWGAKAATVVNEHFILESLTSHSCHVENVVE